MDWDRLEAEFADSDGEIDGIDAEFGAGSPLADRILCAVSARRTRRAVLGVLVGAMLAAGLAVSVLLVALPGRPLTAPGPPSRPAALPSAAAATRAHIYAAALSGGATSQRPAPPIWVNDRLCWAIPTNPIAATCGDGHIPRGVQRKVIALLGPRVRFADAPPVPRRPRDPPVVQFGRLMVQGERAQLGIEVRCGPLCGQGQTLVLREQHGQWRVSGSVGPQWVS